MDKPAPSFPGSDQSTTMALVQRGFLAMLPLWAGAIPFGIAYSISAREAGLTSAEIQIMSLTVFSAASQISAVALVQVGASAIEVLATAIALNVHLLLIGAAVARTLTLSPSIRLGTAWLLTDASYAVAAAQGSLRTPILIGSGLSMYLGWNLGTALGLFAGNAIPDPQGIGLDFVVPLTFLAVLIPMIRSSVLLTVAVLGAGSTVLLVSFLAPGLSILVSAVAASLTGVWLSRGKRGSEDGANR